MSRAWGIGVGTQGYTGGSDLVAKRPDLETGNGTSDSAMASSNGPHS